MHDRSEDIEEEEIEINLSRFRKHERRFPWRLIKNLLVTIILTTLLYFLAQEVVKMNSKKPLNLEEIEVEID
jgi:hypothetical protein